MPISANTDTVRVAVARGVEQAITADGGNVTVESVVTEILDNGSSTEQVQSEGSVLDGERKRYLGPATHLDITPSDADVHWTVTPVRAAR